MITDVSISYGMVTNHQAPLSYGGKRTKVKFTLPPPRRASCNHTILASHQPPESSQYIRQNLEIEIHSPPFYKERDYSCNTPLF